MTRAVFVSLCVIFITIHSTSQLSCSQGEVEDSCPSDCSDSCPIRDHQYSGCETPQVCGQPQCRCGFNMKRAINGTCIATTECPPFKCERPNEEYVSCPPYCPTDDCSSASLDGECPFLILVVRECVPTCRCKKGYWRKNGTCVPYNDCTSSATPLDEEINPGIVV